MPCAVLYADPMADKVEHAKMQEARDGLKGYIDAAVQQGQHTVIERYGQPVAVLVPVGWYVRQGGDPRRPLPHAD